MGNIKWNYEIIAHYKKNLKQQTLQKFILNNTKTQKNIRNENLNYLNDWKFEHE